MTVSMRLSPYIKHNTFSYASRSMSTNQFIWAIPFAFDPMQAANRFAKFKESPSFKQIETPKEGLVILNGSVLKKTYIPFAFGQQITHGTAYKGHYGYDTIDAIAKKDSPACQTRVHWHETEGTLPGRVIAAQNSYIMRIYCGEKYPPSTVEKAMPEEIKLSAAKLLEPNALDCETTIEPFIANAAIIRGIFSNRILKQEKHRAKSTIQLQYMTELSSISHLQVMFNGPATIKYVLVPFYKLQYPNQPPLLLSALPNSSAEEKLPISITKAKIAAIAIASSLLPCMPPFALTSRLALTTTIASGSLLCSINGLGKAQYFFEKQQIKQFHLRQFIIPDKSNKAFIDTLFLQQNISNKKMAQFNQKALQVLGLNPEYTPNQKTIEKAFIKALICSHPDNGGKPKDFYIALYARNILLNQIKPETT